MSDEQMVRSDLSATRRTTLRVAAWTVPAVSVAAATPAWAGSPGSRSLLLVTPTSRRINATQASGANRPVQVQLLNGNNVPVANATVQFSIALTGDAWDIHYDGAGASNGAGVPSATATVTTDASGFATTSYGFVGRPLNPAATRATFIAQSGDATVSFVVGQLSLSNLKVSAFCKHSLAIAEGRAVGWGMNGSQGRLGTGTDGAASNSASPVYAEATSGLSSLTGKVLRDVSPGGTHSVAVDSGGVVHAWGSNSLGEATGVSSSAAVLVPKQVAAGSLVGADVVEVVAGGAFSVARDSLGRVHTWGTNVLGQLGRTGGTAPDLVSLPVAVTKIAAGRFHALALGTDGKVYSWGSNSNGQLGNGRSTQTESPKVDPHRAAAEPVLTRVEPRTWTSPTVELSNIVDIAAGTGHTLAVDASGRVWVCGNNQFAQLGTGANGWPGQSLANDWPTAVSITDAAIATKKVVKVAAGHAHSLCLVEGGTVYGWGQNTVIQLGPAAGTTHQVRQVTGDIESKVIEGIAAGDGTSFAKDSKGVGYAWGWQDNGRLGNGVVSNLGALPGEVSVASLIP